MSFKALVIPVDGPLYEIELTNHDTSDLAKLQEAVGGYIEGVPLPRFLKGSAKAYGFIHGEGKYVHKPNMRATDFMVPGIGLHVGDYIAGPMILAGRDNEGGIAELPPDVIERARLIEQEAG